MDEQSNIQNLLLEIESLREELHNHIQTNAELLVYKQQLDAILNNAPVEVYLKDREGRYLRINKQFEKIFGVKNEDLVGLLPADVHDPELAASTRDQDLFVLNSGKVERREEVAELVSDKQLHTLLTIKFPVFNEDGEVDGLGAIVTDITELKIEEQKLHQSHELFARSFQTSPNLIALVEPFTGKHFDVNDTYLDTLKFTRDEIIGKTSFDFQPWADFRDRKSILKMHSEDGSVRGFHAQLKAKDGTLIDCSISTDPMKLNHMELVLWTITDITEQKNIEAQLRQSQRMEAVGQLTGGIAHDFNNLLGVMIGNAELLKLYSGKERRSLHNVDMIIRAVNRASSLTNRLLAFSRQQTLAPKATNINNLIDSLEKMLGRTLGETIDLKSAHSPELWLATIDSHQFENALVNLALNARDAMPNGGMLTIETANMTLDNAYAKQHEEVIPGDYVMVTVSDTGEGMSPEVLGKVFEPFFTTKGVGEGSGLGLSMVHGFAKQSKGHITIDSEEGRGTTVKLYMPRSSNATVEETTNEATPEFELRSGHILVVEDDENLREITVSILRDQGYKIVEAKDGDQAIDRLRDKQPFDLLFTDVVLPGSMNGIDIAKEAKQLQPHIKVLYTTGYAENAALHEGKPDRSMSLINKPYRRVDLLAMVSTILEGKSVLLIEDDKELRITLTSGLRRFGYSVTTASGGAEGQDLLKSKQFDSVVTDLVMEECEGVETLLWIKQHSPGTPVIVISGHPSHLDMVRELGAFATLEKPFKVEDLIKAIREVKPSRV